MTCSKRQQLTHSKLVPSTCQNSIQCIFSYSNNISVLSFNEFPFNMQEEMQLLVQSFNYEIFYHVKKTITLYEQFVSINVALSVYQCRWLRYVDEDKCLWLESPIYHTIKFLSHDIVGKTLKMRINIYLYVTGMPLTYGHRNRSRFITTSSNCVSGDLLQLSWQNCGLQFERSQDQIPSGTLHFQEIKHAPL